MRSLWEGIGILWCFEGRINDNSERALVGHLPLLAFSPSFIVVISFVHQSNTTLYKAKPMVPFR
jgi:hypothetical protein